MTGAHPSLIWRHFQHERPLERIRELVLRPEQTAPGTLRSRAWLESFWLSRPRRACSCGATGFRPGPAGILDELKPEIPPPLPGSLDEPAEPRSWTCRIFPRRVLRSQGTARRATNPRPTTTSRPRRQRARPEKSQRPTSAAGGDGTESREPPACPPICCPLVLLFLAVMLGLWFLLRRMNEVPPGRIIQQGDVGVTGSRSGASPG